MDILHIHQLTLETTIGIHAWEKAILQKVVLDIDLACDCQAIAQNDCIDDAYDYDMLTQKLAHFLKETQTELIETLVEKIASFLHESTGTKWLKIKLIKPGAIRLAKQIAVTIERRFD